jgi:hypothetical protein
MSDKTETARKIAKDLASRPENKPVDSAWYCIAVHSESLTFGALAHCFRQPHLPLEILVQGWSKYTKLPLKDELQQKLESSFVASKSPWQKAACSSAFPKC